MGLGNTAEGSPALSHALIVVIDNMPWWCWKHNDVADHSEM